MFLYRISFKSLPEIFQDFFLHLVLCLNVERTNTEQKQKQLAKLNVVSLSSTWNLKYHFTWINFVARSNHHCSCVGQGIWKQWGAPGQVTNLCKRMAILLTSLLLKKKTTKPQSGGALPLEISDA